MNVVIIYFIPPPLAGGEQASDCAERWAPNSLNKVGLTITEAEI